MDVIGMTDNLITVRALAARTRVDRDASITRTLERVGIKGLVLDLLRGALSLDMLADSTAGGGTLSVADVATRYKMSKSQANRYIRGGKIVATHDSLRDAVLAVVDAPEDASGEVLAAVMPVLDLLAVIGRNGTDRPAPTAAEIESVALSPSGDPVAALDALIDARPVVATESGESGESEESGESGEATPEDLAARDAVMAREALGRIMARDGASLLIPADEWNAIVAQVTEITAARRKATNRARASKPAA